MVEEGLEPYLSATPMADLDDLVFPKLYDRRRAHPLNKYDMMVVSRTKGREDAIMSLT